MSDKKTPINFRRKSFLKNIIEGTANGQIPGWDDLPEIDLGNEPEVSYSNMMDNNINALEKPNLEDMLLFIWTAAPSKLKKALGEYKIKIANKNDLAWLIKWNENGDFRVWIQTHGFTPVNLEDIICKISLTQSELRSTTAIHWGS